MRFAKIIFLSILIGLLFNGCEKDRPLVFFSVDNDIQLGKQTEAEIASRPNEFKILDSASNKEAYQYLYKIRNKILNSGKVFFKDRFAWKLYIIQDDSTLNAFCTPGGYIYVYTGLIKYLSREDHLAGVIGHEIAHADRRHTSSSLQTQYGIGVLLDVVLGNNPSVLKEIAGGIYSLKNSRVHETEADEYSVRYLCPTDYYANGAAGFFQKLINDGYDCESSAFFSTHPNSCDRVSKINAKSTELGCGGSGSFESEYAAFKAKL
jgi:predicted Zn-dependent protease